MADEATITAPTEPSLEQQLEMFKAEQTSPAPPAQPAAETPTTPTVPMAEAPKPEMPAAAEPTLEDKLKAIDETPTPEPPKLTSEQEQILATVPTVQQARALSEAAQNFQKLDQFVAARDFASLEAMFEPAALDDFKEYLYQKHVASGEWVDRWVADKEGNPTVHRGLQSLEQKISDLQRQIAARQADEQTASVNAARAQIAQGYSRHLESLFDKIDFSKEDRRWVASDIKSRLESDPAVLHAIHSGNFSAMNATFKAAVKEYSERDRSTRQAADQMQRAQEQHKPLAPATPALQLNSLPEDINQVPAGREDDWMMQELQKLGAATRGRK